MAHLDNPLTDTLHHCASCGHKVDRRIFLYVAAALGGALLTATRALADAVTIDSIGDRVQTVPRDQLPDFVKPSTPDVRRLYRYAVDHGDELQYIPCTCGCARSGHKSNRDCYIKTFHADGSLTFTSHAAT